MKWLSSRAWLEEATVWPGRFANLLFWWQAGGFFCLGRIFLVDDNQGEGGEIASLSFFHSDSLHSAVLTALNSHTDSFHFSCEVAVRLAREIPTRTDSKLVFPCLQFHPVWCGPLADLTVWLWVNDSPRYLGFTFRNMKLEIPWKREGERHPTLRVMG